MSRGAVLRLASVVAVVLAAGAGAWLVLPGGGADSSTHDDDGSAVTTAPVERRVLESLQVTRGTVLAPSQATVLAGGPGEGELAVVVTGLPVPLGSEVRAGGVTVELNGRPVFALPGAIPVYRNIRPGDAGPDVAGVQLALQSLGYEVRESERTAETFGATSQRAIERLYEDAGYEPAYTLGSREAVAEAERAADEAVDAAQSARDAAGQPVGDVPASPGAVEAAQDALDAATAASDSVHDAEGVMLPAREFVAVPSLPASIVSLPVAVGESVDAGMPVTTIGSSQFVVRIELTAAQVNELADDVEISVLSDGGYAATCPAVAPRPADAGSGEGTTAGESPPGGDGAAEPADDGAPAADGSGDAPDADAGDGTGGGATSSDAYVMDVVCDPLPPADSLGTGMRVTMTVRRSDGEVLVVPATAVTMTSSGDVFVEVIGTDGESTRVEVAMGGEADGFVEVTPIDSAALADGMDVRVRRS